MPYNIEKIVNNILKSDKIYRDILQDKVNNRNLKGYLKKSEINLTDMNVKFLQHAIRMIRSDLKMGNKKKDYVHPKQTKFNLENYDNDKNTENNQ